jgi:prepilin-type N-terminal cleavage/methylation domain-containing protein
MIRPGAKGFTLIEVLVALGIVAIALMAGSTRGQSLPAIFPMRGYSLIRLDLCDK